MVNEPPELRQLPDRRMSQVESRTMTRAGWGGVEGVGVGGGGSYDKGDLLSRLTVCTVH